MKSTIKRAAATAAIAGVMFIGAQGVASAEADPINSTDVSGLSLLNGITVNAPVSVPVVINDTNVDLTVLDLLG